MKNEADMTPDDKFRSIQRMQVTALGVFLTWRILFVFFDVFANPKTVSLFLTIGGISILIGLVYGISILKLKVTDITAQKNFLRYVLTNIFFWFGCMVWVQYFFIRH